MQSHTRIKKKILKKTKKSTPEVPDVSNTGVFHGKTQMLSCSSSTCPSTGAPVQENFIITCSHHVLRVTNLGNISDAQLFPRCFGKLCQSCHLSDRLISGEQSPFWSPTETVPFILELGSCSYVLWVQNKAPAGFLANCLFSALGTVVINVTGEVKKSGTKLLLRTIYTVTLIWVLKIESIHTTHFI